MLLLVDPIDESSPQLPAGGMMPHDLYTKTVLTIIAGALAVLAWQGTLRPANAVSECGGSRSNVCYVVLVNSSSVPVTVENWPNLKR
jgi:hypothetical protein